MVNQSIEAGVKLKAFSIVFLCGAFTYAGIVTGMVTVPAVRGQDVVRSQKATGSQPRFEAADVHLSPPAINPYNYASGGVQRGERYELRKATMLDLIKTA